MIKHFCDICGNEYQPAPGIARETVIMGEGGITATVHVTVKSKAEVCLKCIVAAVNDMQEKAA